MRRRSWAHVFEDQRSPDYRTPLSSSTQARQKVRSRSASSGPEYLFIADARARLPIPVSLSYSTKSEFLGDPDHKLSSHVGLSYNLDKLLGKK